MIFLVVDKEKCLCYGVFNDEEKAKKYMNNSEGCRIIYLGENELNQIKELSKKGIEDVGYVKEKYGLYWVIREHHEGETLSGGGVVAFFPFESDADEYLKFKCKK